MQAPTLFVIAQDLAHMQVLASVDESDIGRVQPGQKVSFSVDAYPGETFGGTVSQVRLQPTVDQNVVSYTTVIDVPNPDLRLKPGMTASVSVEIARADATLRVPSAALRFRPPSASGAPGAASRSAPDASPQTVATGAPTGARPPRDSNTRRIFVWTGRDIEPRRIQVGLSDGTMTAVTGGDLVEGAEVVTAMADTTQRAAATATSPLLPFGNRRGGAGFGGGGGGSSRPAAPGGGGR